MSGTQQEKELVTAALVKLRARIMAAVLGLAGGSGIFLATASLLVQGGENVGQHLSLLSNYFPGYTVTWPGAFLGLAYGALTGAIAGYVLAWIYNRLTERGR